MYYGNNDYRDYLMHSGHKYIERKWVNGKWQYVYERPQNNNSLRNKAYQGVKSVREAHSMAVGGSKNHIRGKYVSEDGNVYNTKDTKGASSRIRMDGQTIRRDVSKTSLAFDKALRNIENRLDPTAAGYRKRRKLNERDAKRAEKKKKKKSIIGHKTTTDVKIL